MSRLTAIVVGLIGTGLFAVFVLGLSQSISTGFAGFWGGFPFLIIAIAVIAMAVYNFWEDAVRKKDR